MNVRLRRIWRVAYGAACVLSLVLSAASVSAAGVALVIGNAAYEEGRLINAANDARLIAATLQDAGFDVTLAIDQSGAQMRSALRDFAGRLSSQRQPAVFYFAGHGVQVDWTNYLLPVDAHPRSVGELQRQAVPLDELFTHLHGAANGLNVVILDACRDNPFNTAGVRRGLSQTDAPTGTLLAYATAPGNVALDGLEGSRHSLYTEHLAREMRSPGARIEDVFKRVRLQVRLKTRGAQVPWESTSLEEDYAFFPVGTPAPKAQPEKAESHGLLPPEAATPQAVASSSGSAGAPQSASASDPVDAKSPTADLSAMGERTTWQAAESAGTVDALRDFLLAYPSSAYAELAQQRMDRLLAPQEQRPASVTPLQVLMASPDAASNLSQSLPPAVDRLQRGWRVGDLLVWREQDHLAWFKRERTVRHRVLVLTEEQMTMRNGERFDLHFNRMSVPDWQWGSPATLLVADYSVGKTWSTEFKRIYRSSHQLADVHATGRVAARELMTVPAGQFETYRVEIRGATGHAEGAWPFEETYWVDAASGKPVRYERKETRPDGRQVVHETGELLSFENGGSPARE